MAINYKSFQKIVVRAANILQNNKIFKNTGINEETDISLIKRTWTAINNDLPVEFNDRSGAFWLHIQNPVKPGSSQFRCVNIGRYYNVQFKGNSVIFWVGVEAKDNEEYAMLYMNADQHADLQSMTICGNKPNQDGVFYIKIPEFSSGWKCKCRLKRALKQKLNIFIQAIKK